MGNLSRKLLKLAASGAVVGIVARSLVRESRRFDWAGKTAVVTGGSRGLGLVLARELVDRGVDVAILARTSADLDAAEEKLTARGGNVLAMECDVREPRQVEICVEQATRYFGGIDLLFNVAGIIHVGPLEAMTREDFEHAMDVNCWGTFNAVQAVLPDMRARGWGRIVNIASLGGKRAVPHMLPYAMSKFAQVGLSKGLRAELWKYGIYVTTVCPSLMRTGSPRNAIFKGQNDKEYTWFSIGDSLPVLSMSAEEAAEQILEACQKGQSEVLLRNPANLTLLAQEWFPQLTQTILNYADRLLPAMGGIGREAARGYDSQTEWSPSWITQLGDEAARENNEMRDHPLESGRNTA